MAEYKSIYTGEQIDAGITKANTALQQETDPIFSASPSANITNQDIANWNGKSNFSGSYNDLTDKPNIPSATSDLTNDSGFITNSVNNLVNYYLKNEVYTKQEVAELIGAIQQFHYEVVQELPQTGENNIMYLVPKLTSQTNNVYDEYVYSNGWEKIGDTEIDLTNYVTITMLNQALADYTTTANLTTLLNAKQDVIDSTHKLDASLVDDSLSANKFVTSAEKTTWNGKQDTIQYSTMPTASAETVGKIVQYTGTTDSTYTNGYFYQVISDGQEPATYSWENINVQASGQIPSNLKVYYLEDNSAENPFIVDDNEEGVYFLPYNYTNVRTVKFDVYFKKNRSNTSNRTVQMITPTYFILKINNGVKQIHYFGTNYTVYEGIRARAWYLTPNDSDSSGLRYDYVQDFSGGKPVFLTEAQTIEAQKTFTVLPQSSVTPTTDNQFVNKKYVDDSISSAVGTINTVLATLTTPTNGGE